MSLSKFDTVAEQYEAGRPGYPAELFDVIEEFSGSFIGGARIADIGAGTGKAARELVSRGGCVVAVDHGARMLATLRANMPGTALALGDANALPFADDSLDFVTFAQSWHWVDPARAPAEVERVTRPGGAIALWWNIADPESEPWYTEHRRRLREISHGSAAGQIDAAWRAIPSVFAHVDVEIAHIGWSRAVTKEIVLAEACSKSYVAELGEPGRREFVERESALLPDGELREPFVTNLAVVRVPA